MFEILGQGAGQRRDAPCQQAREPVAEKSARPLEAIDPPKTGGKARVLLVSAPGSRSQHGGEAHRAVVVEPVGRLRADALGHEIGEDRRFTFEPGERVCRVAAASLPLAQFAARGGRLTCS